MKDLHVHKVIVIDERVRSECKSEKKGKRTTEEDRRGKMERGEEYMHLCTPGVSTKGVESKACSLLLITVTLSESALE